MDPLRESLHEPVRPDGTRSGLSDPDVAKPPWWRRLTVPFEVVIASVVVAAMVLLAGLLIYQVGTSARQAIITAADDSAQHISQLISERVHHIVDPADATLRLLAFDPVAAATSLQARLRRLPVFVRLLEQNPLLSAVYIGYSDGQFLLVRPLRDAAFRARMEAPAEAAFLVQSMARERGTTGLTGRWNYYDAQLGLLRSSVRPEYRFDLTLADRVMTLADIFEALTAADRPYKSPKTLSESLNIMSHMVRERHLDADVFRFFLTSGVWRDYAERFLTPAQRDTVDVDALVASLG